MKFNWLIRIMILILTTFALFVMIIGQESINMYIYLGLALIVFSIMAYTLGQFVKREPKS